MPQYERGGLRERMRDSLMLIIFITASALVAIVTMDLLVYPLAQFAVSHSDFYTQLVREGTRWAIITAMGIWVIVTTISLSRHHRNAIKVATHLLRKIGGIVVHGVLFITATGLLMVTVYFVFRGNSMTLHYLHMITGG